MAEPLSRAEVIARLTDSFRANGYEGASLSSLSNASGLKRASLYHHFPRGKVEMAEAVLEAAGDRFEREVLAPLRGGGAPADRLAQMIDGLHAFYEGGDKACLLALMSVGEARGLFAPHVRGALERWIGDLAVLLSQAGLSAERARAEAEDAVACVQGALVLARGLGDAKPFERCLQRLATLLQASRE